MSKFFTLVVLSLIFSFAAKAQYDTTAYYINKSGHLTFSKQEAVYIRVTVVPKKPNGKLSNVTDFYLDYKLKSSGMSSSPRPQYGYDLQGEYDEFFRNGNKKAIKHYKDNLLVGEVTNYYPNGQLYTIEEVDKNSASYLKECRDSTGKLLTENGNGTWIKFNNDFNSIYEKGKVVNGKEEGVWKGWEDDTLYPDSLTEVAVYEHGKMISGKHNENKIFTEVETNPEFQGGIENFYNYLGRTVRYPAPDRENNIQGKVFIGFVVEKDGTLSNINIIKGVSKGLDEEAIRVIKLSPRWTPATSKGKPVRCQYNVPISFTLAGEE